MKLEHALSAFSDKISRQDLQAAYKILSSAYRSGRKISLNSESLALAYLHIRMPATIVVLEKVIGYLDAYAADIKTLLDLGCGPGSIVWASQNSLAHLEKITLVDQAQGLMELGNQLLEHYENKDKMIWVKKDILAFLTKTSENSANNSKYDLTSLSYILNELTPNIQRKIITYTWCQTEKFLIIIEPGTPQGFMNIRRAREQLILEGAKILAPCTHENNCPLSEQDWCHFSERLNRSKLHQQLKGYLPYEDEKYSFLIATRHENISRPDSRVVKKPLHSSGLIELSLCTQLGLISQKISKRSSEEYKSARKIKWGNGWPHKLS